MIYITGDTHGDFFRIELFCEQNETTKDDIMIILGDVGINYYGERRDMVLKQKLSALPITLFCIHGNHEKRPQNINTYKRKTKFGGTVLYEKAYPNILFAEDGQVYNFNGKQCLVIGGAYSVDKFYRLAKGWNWWPDEQPSDSVKFEVESTLIKRDWQIDRLLTHTCPQKYTPVEVFLPTIDQSTVDTSTEEWLDTLEDRLTYQKWYCGHYHTDKTIDKLKFMFNTICVFE